MIPIWTELTHTLNSSLVHLSDQEDKLIWSFSPSEKYSPKLEYTAQFQATNLDPPPWWGKSLWRFNSPPKLKLFMWLILQNKAPTWENLQKHSFTRPSRCALCKSEEETNTHLFLDCTFTKSIWLEISRSLGPSLIWNGTNILEALQFWLAEQQNQNYKVLPLMVGWEIWLARNHAIFEDKPRTTFHTAIACLKIFSPFPQKALFQPGQECLNHQK